MSAIPAPVPATLVKAWTAARDRLKAAGIDSPVIDARLLVEAAAGVTRTDLVTDPHRPLDTVQIAQLDGYVDRRSRREPLSHILGRKGFWKIMLNVDARVLTPRPETEVIVDHALRAFGEQDRFSLLDLGVGSGAILMAILAERPHAKGVGVDLSDDALAVARDNAARLGLEGRMVLLRGDWAGALKAESFELAVANPPYVRSGEIAALAPEVRDHEPRLALDGGEDGLRDYRTLAPQVMRVLKPGGVFLVETGFDQAAQVADLFTGQGAEGVCVLKDLSDRERVVAGRRGA